MKNSIRLLLLAFAIPAGVSATAQELKGCKAPGPNEAPVPICDCYPEFCAPIPDFGVSGVSSQLEIKNVADKICDTNLGQCEDELHEPHPQNVRQRWMMMTGDQRPVASMDTLFGELEDAYPAENPRIIFIDPASTFIDSSGSLLTKQGQYLEMADVMPPGSLDMPVDICSKYPEFCELKDELSGVSLGGEGLAAWSAEEKAQSNLGMASAFPGGPNGYQILTIDPKQVFGVGNTMFVLPSTE